MKHFFLMTLLLICQLSFGQIKGNQNIITKTFDLSEVERIDIGLYAEVVIDMAIEESISITIDENLMDKINFEIEDKQMELNQKEWIQPSSPALIKIGAPNLTFISQGTHDKVLVKNINAQNFVAQALLGEIELQGNVQTLNANAETGEIDATQLQSQLTNVNIWSSGVLKVGETARLEGSVKNTGQVFYQGNPDVKVKVKTEGTVNKIDEAFNKEEAATSNSKKRGTYIEFDIKNNSMKRLQFYVKGPKPDGKYFSYGFPMNPGQKRSENWTVGTKVYRVTSMHTKILLIEITAEDEGQTVDLFEK